MHCFSAESKEKPPEAEAAKAARDVPKLNRFGKSSESRDSEFSQQHSDDLDWLCSEVSAADTDPSVIFVWALLIRMPQIKVR